MKQLIYLALVMLLLSCTNTQTEIQLRDQYNVSDQILFNQYPVKMKLVFDVSQPTALSFPARYGIKFGNQQGDYLIIAYNNEVSCFYLVQFMASTNTLSNPQLVRYELTGKTLDWRIELNKSSIGLFAADDQIALTDTIATGKSFDSVVLFTETGTIKLNAEFN